MHTDPHTHTHRHIHIIKKNKINPLKNTLCTVNFLLLYEDDKEFSSLQIFGNAKTVIKYSYACHIYNFRNIVPHLHLCPRTHHILYHFYETLLSSGVFETVSHTVNQTCPDSEAILLSCGLTVRTLHGCATIPDLNPSICF